MKNIFITILILLAGFAGIFGLSRVLEKIKPQPNETAIDDDLYFSAQEISHAGHDFRGLIADWYWINSLQYLGGKIVKNQDSGTQQVDINNLKPLNPRLLYPMLDTATTLDPQFMTVYSYGASVLPAIDNNLAIKLLEKGVRANPDEWRLYHNLGYIYWQMKDYQNAAKYYAEGAGKKDAPVWMKQMSAAMQANGGSREFALEIYKQMSETAEDEQTKSFAELRYQQTLALVQMDSLRTSLNIFRTKNNRCPQNWQEFIPYVSKSAGDWKVNNKNEIVDPTETPFQLINENNSCDVKIAPNSKIPQPEK